ncbi:hypothetical protein BU23DRAFT_562756 [Bimuria novae-zelandiae CBS 107.79]|uniref:Uncharacterized protein n=1 Tax=Bimuria novae-zelandiae CBS 107.79 TaxID=1447943 RepID=A0A6A5VSQ6_9PLEO|nr:hypothetical protein BU23DRAFT_562756 [Bimuria novae-zelandiae CBS 107.79]
MATNKEIAALFDPPTTKDAIAKLVRRIRDRADQEGISITNPTLYETLPGRGRPELLDDAQKKRIIEIVTQDRAHREKEPLQAIKDGDFDELPPMSVSTFENVMYEAGEATLAGALPRRQCLGARMAMDSAAYYEGDAAIYMRG